MTRRKNAIENTESTIVETQPQYTIYLHEYCGVQQSNSISILII